MLHTLRFSLQNAIYFIMLPFLVHVLFTFYIKVCQNLNIKLRFQKVKLFSVINIINKGRDSSVDILTRLQEGRPRNGGSIPAETRGLSLF
jgi:hypothetical protein